MEKLFIPKLRSSWNCLFQSYDHLEMFTIILKLFIPKLRSHWNCLFQSYDHLVYSIPKLRSSWIVYSKVTIILKLFIPKLRSSWNCLFQSYDHLEIIYSKVTIILKLFIPKLRSSWIFLFQSYDHPFYELQSPELVKLTMTKTASSLLLRWTILSVNRTKMGKNDLIILEWWQLKLWSAV